MELSSFTYRFYFESEAPTNLSDMRDALGNGLRQRGYDFNGAILTADFPNTVDAHGKYGVADGAGYVPYADLHKHARVVNVGMADARPATIHQPEERPATCACYVGSGATPYAHEPSCPVHPRYADTQLLEFNGEVQEFYTSLLDGSKCDGKRANLEAEYLGALASLKARGAADGALYRIHELGKSLGRSVHGVCADFNR